MLKNYLIGSEKILSENWERKQFQAALDSAFRLHQQKPNRDGTKPLADLSFPFTYSGH